MDLWIYSLYLIYFSGAHHPFGGREAGEKKHPAEGEIPPDLQDLSRHDKKREISRIPRISRSGRITESCS
jgi:hypothetical protein